MISYITTIGRSNFNSCEDSLTSTVFDFLKYLPTTIFWDLLKKSLYHQKLPKYSGEINSIEYWPSWSAENTENSKRVVPDVFISFDEFDVLIEAKRYNVGGQLKNQFENEFKSYQNEYGDKNKMLYFIKLGGLNNRNDEKSPYSKVVICKTDWTKLLNEVVLLRAELERGNSILNQNYIRLINDCIKGFALHHFYKIEWLKDLSKISINKTNIPIKF